MRLEVLADNKVAVIYVLNRPEIYIGSHENNDIVIPLSEISKKHLKLLITDDGKCFAIDQGSTNGSFINDERLVPGKREDFPILTSMRLGDKVLLTLLDKDNGNLPVLPLREQFVEENKVRLADEDKTRVISLKTLQKTKTEKVKKKRLKKLEKELKKKKESRKDKATINRAVITALVIMGLGWGAMKFVAHNRKKNRTTIIAKIKETQIMIDDSLESVEDNVADILIPQQELIPIADIARHTEDISCSLPDEAFFCKRMPRGSKNKNGAINLNGQIVIYLEQKEWIAKAQSLVSLHAELNLNPKDTAAESEKLIANRMENAGMETGVVTPKAEATGGEVSIDTLNRIAFLQYLKTHLSIPMPIEMQEKNLYIVFYSHVGTSMDIDSVTAIKASYVTQVNLRYTVDFFRFRKYDPYRIIKKLDRYYRLY